MKSPIPNPESNTPNGSSASAKQLQQHIHSLLETPLGVPLPLHISLSAPLVLRTETKDGFLAALLTSFKSLAKKHSSGITVNPDHLSWHLNEDGSRGFLVLRVLEFSDCGGASDRILRDDQGRERRSGQAQDQKQKQSQEQEQSSKQEQEQEQEQKPRTTTGLGYGRGQGPESTNQTGSRSRNARNGGLNDLLNATNRVAKAFGQPQLYVSRTSESRRSAETIATMDRGDFSGYYHISIAWSLTVPSTPPVPVTRDQKSRGGDAGDLSQTTWSPEVERVMDKVKNMRIGFNQVKVKIGQDITSVSFGAAKARNVNLFSA